MRPKQQRVPNHQLRHARQKRGWSQEQLAEQLGTNTFTISRWERGTAIPRPFFRQLLTTLFGLPLEELGLLPAVGSMAEEAPSSQAAHGTGATPPSSVQYPAPMLLPPLHAPEQLVGREAILHQIKTRLLAEKPRVPCVLQGLPGVGKTALALTLAHDPDIHARFPDGVLWAGLGRQPHVLEIFSRWGIQLGLSVEHLAQLDSLPAWAQTIQHAIGARRLLLVLDDAWQFEVALACKVGGPACAHLLTTRSLEVALQFGGEGIFPLPELSEEASLEILRRFTPQGVAAAPEDIQHLVRTVGGLPLGLVLLGKYLQLQSYGGQPRRVRAALEHLSKRVERLHLAQPQAPVELHPSLPGDIPLSLQASIALSVDALTAEAQAMLGALAVFPPKPTSFSEEAALAVAAFPAATLDRLVDAGLVESQGAGRYMLHQTIADYAQVQGGLEAAEERLVRRVVSILEAHSSPRQQLDQDLPIILEALRLAQQRGWQTLFLRGTLALAPFLMLHGLYTDAEEHLLQALTVARASGDADRIAAILVQLGTLAERRSQYEQAERYLQEGLQVAQERGRSDQISAALHILGLVAAGRGDNAQEIMYYQEALTLARELDDRARSIELLNNLGAQAAQQGNLSEATIYLEEGLHLAQQQDAREVVRKMLINLGALAAEGGNFQKAEAAFLEGLSLSREIKDVEGIGISLANLGELARRGGQYPQALTYLEEALALARQLDLPGRILVRLLTLGEVSLSCQREEEAQAYLEEALALARLLGQQDRLSEVLRALGELFTQREAYTQAEHALQESIQLAHQLQQQFLLGTALEVMGRLQLKQRHLEGAADAFSEALVLARTLRHLGQEAKALWGLAQLAAAQGRFAEAQQYGQQSLVFLQSRDPGQYEKVAAWLTSLPKAPPLSPDQMQDDEIARLNGNRRRQEESR